MSNDIKKGGQEPQQMGLLDELMDVGREAMGFVEGMRVTHGAERKVQRIESEPMDASVVHVLRRILEANRGRRVTLVIESDEFRASIGEGVQLRLCGATTLGGSVHGLAEKLDLLHDVGVTPARQPLDNKQRASGEKDED